MSPAATRVVVNGAAGRMGSLAVAAIGAAEGLELVGSCGRGDDLPGAIRAGRADVVVDFTRPDCVRANALAILEAGARPVIGTSGVDGATRGELVKRCESLQRGGILAPNFAIGAVLMMRLAEIAAEHLPAVEIVEAHHAQKVDAPSGTAIATAERLARSRGATIVPAGGVARGELRSGIPVHSLRLPGVVAEQSVCFGELGQKLTIEHVTYSREAYMPGVVLACRRVMKLDRFVVGLDEILFAKGGG
jgi:4-hydroxy-tetrahydrodipicolinate reductase